MNLFYNVTQILLQGSETWRVKLKIHIIHIIIKQAGNLHLSMPEKDPKNTCILARENQQQVTLGKHRAKNVFLTSRDPQVQMELFWPHTAETNS